MSNSGSKDTRELQLVATDVPFREAVKQWTVPQVELLGESHFANFDLKAISHVVLQYVGRTP
jgi:hypothetical protein